MAEAAAVAAAEEVAREAAVQVVRQEVEATRAGCVAAKAKYTQTCEALRRTRAGLTIDVRAIDNTHKKQKRLIRKMNMARQHASDTDLAALQSDYDVVQNSQKGFADDLPKVQAAMIAALNAKDAAHAEWTEAERHESATALALRRLMLSHAPLH